MNLREETLKIMKDNGLTKEDVAFIMVREQVYENNKYENKDYRLPMDRFWLSANTEYDEGFGGNEINLGLMIVFKNGAWLERHEYDGSEWWEFKSTPKKPENYTTPNMLWDKYKKE